MEVKIRPEVEGLRGEMEEFLKIVNREIQKIPDEEVRKRNLLGLIRKIGMYQELSGPKVSVFIGKILGVMDTDDTYEKREQIIKQLLRKEILEGHSPLVEPLQGVLLRIIEKGDFVTPRDITWAFYTIRENLLREVQKFELTLEEVQFLVSRDGIDDKILEQFFWQIRKLRESSTQ